MAEQYCGIDPETGNVIEVSVEHGCVASILPVQGPCGGSSSIAHADLSFIVRGFIDIQVNGYKGIDYSDSGLDAEKISQLVQYLASGGITQHLPTIVTRPHEQMVRSLKTIASARQKSPPLASAICGVHLEGPWISAEDGPRGAHDPRYIRTPDFTEFLRLQDAAQGLIKMVTLAPEIEGALDFIEKITAQGVIAAIGHTAASPEQIRDAVSAGCSLSTHLGNGSHAVLPRLRNYVWEQLAADELFASIIADGFHLPPSVQRIMARAKGLERLILVSDVAQYGGMPPGRYRWGELGVEVFDDGHVGLVGTSFLAGAGHLLNWDISVFMHSSGVTLAQALRLCTVNPARLLAKAGVKLAEKLTVGAPADIVLLDFDGGRRLSVRIAKVLKKGSDP